MRTKCMVMIFALMFVHGLCYGERTIEYRAVISAIADDGALQVTNKILNGGTIFSGKYRIPLDGIETDSNATAATAACEFLRRTLVGKEVNIIEHMDRDKSYGAWVFIQNSSNSVNLMLIESGHARRTGKQSVSSSMHPEIKEQIDRMLPAERCARESAKGIWALTNGIPPTLNPK